MEKIVEEGILYDFYGSLLTEHQQKIYEDCVYHDLSLGEIAENEGISRQAVSDLIRRCTVQMKGYEKKLGMIEKYRHIRMLCEDLRQAGSREEVKGLADEIERELK